MTAAGNLEAWYSVSVYHIPSRMNHGHEQPCTSCSERFMNSYIHDEESGTWYHKMQARLLDLVSSLTLFLPLLKLQLKKKL